MAQRAAVHKFQLTVQPAHHWRPMAQRLAGNKFWFILELLFLQPAHYWRAMAQRVAENKFWFRVQPANRPRSMAHRVADHQFCLYRNDGRRILQQANCRRSMAQRVTEPTLSTQF